MGKTAKVAISLPRDVLEAVETERKAAGESRSQFFRRAIETMLRRERESSTVNDYVRGYQEIAESAEEVEATLRSGIAGLAEEPWA